MKKIFLAFAAVAMMASCAKEAGFVPSFQQYSDAAVRIGAYYNTNISRGKVVTVEQFVSADAGIGVFAFYQPAVNGVAAAKFTTAKYPTPDFMYNQQVKMSASGEAGVWTYSPVKYWPNNKNDKLSFFAYAPYVSTTSWEDLGFATDGAGTNITKTFLINNAVKDQIDYLFAEPLTDQYKPGTISQDGLGTGVVSNYASGSATSNNDVMRFNFKHVLSKLNLYIGVNVDDNIRINASGNASGNAFAWRDENTTITIKSIEFKDLAETYTWTKGTSSSAVASWVAEGSQNIKVVPSDMDGANLIQAASSDAAKSWWDPRWHRVLDGSADATNPTDEYMFIAPQEVKEKKIVITYVVETTGGDLNSSKITNVITKKWGDFENAYLDSLETGKQYRLFFIIGMQSVKLAATITDWEDATHPEDIIYLPAANEDEDLLSED